MRSTDASSFSTALAAGRWPSATSASGSRCVRTESTSGIAARIAASTCSAASWAPSSDSVPGSLRWREISVRPPTSITFTLWISRTPGTWSAAACTRSRRAASEPACGSTWTTTSASGSARRTASSTSSAEAWPCATAAPGGTPITTSTKCRPAACRSRSRRRLTPGTLRSIACLAAAVASAGARSISTSMLRRIRRVAATSTITATTSAAIGSASGYPARASASPISTATDPTRSLAKWSALDCKAALEYRLAARHETTARVMSIRITTPTTTNAYQVGSTSDELEPVSRVRALQMITPVARTRTVASASADRCSAFPCP